jgi:hypothetical protein
MNIEFVDELLDIGGYLTAADGFPGQGIFRPRPEVIKALICCGSFFRHGSAGISSEKGDGSIYHQLPFSAFFSFPDIKRSGHM